MAWLGAVQAQDYLGALWAVGLRTPGATEQTVEQDDMSIKYKSFVSEAEMISHFWNGLTDRHYNAFISFNGRNFDCPFLMLRSAALGVRPSVNLMAGTRWNYTVKIKNYEIDHIDLAEKLVYGSGFDKNAANGLESSTVLSLFASVFLTCGVQLFKSPLAVER